MSSQNRIKLIATAPSPKFNEKLTVQSYQLAQRQGLPLECKVQLTRSRIKQWYEKWDGKVYVAFSGGKDSTVLLHIVRDMFPDVPALFVDTGLEYPEIREFVKGFDGVVWAKPNQTFKEVLDKHGFPVISKAVADAIRRIQSPGSSEKTRNKALYGDERGSYGKLPNKWRFLLDAPFKISERCCDVMKMRPAQAYGRRTGRVGIVGTMAADSNKRMAQYLKHGCNIMNKGLPKCTPMGFWLDTDVWDYIHQNSVPYCPIYDTGVHHTGCMFCMFGVHKESEPNRFQCMKNTHPRLHKYCMENLGIKEVLDYIGVKSE